MTAPVHSPRPRPDGVSRAVVWGLPLAWTLHDIEELLAFVIQSGALREGLRVPDWVPDGVTEQIDQLTVLQESLAIAVVGLGVAAATVLGWRSRGRNLLFQAAVLGFGIHGIAHLAQAVAVGGYIPGLVMSVLLVVPYGFWATWRLHRAGLLPRRRGTVAAAAGIALTVTLVVLAQGLAALVT